jgi:hypothetical protein
VSQQLNLFNPVFLKQKKYFSARTMARAMGIVLLGFFIIYAVQRLHLAQWQKQLEEANAQFDDTQRQLTQFAAEGKRAPSKALEDETERLEAQADSQEAVLDGLESGSLGSTQGFSPYFVALARQTLSGVWLTGFTARGEEGPVSIRGRLLRQELLPTYLRMLANEDAMRGRGFTELQITTREEKDAAGPSYVEFNLGGPKTPAPPRKYGERLIDRARAAAAGGRS